MKKILTILFLLVIARLSAWSYDTGNLEFSYTENGLSYNLSIYVPDTYNPSMSMPIIVAIHANQDSSQSMLKMMDSLGYQTNFIIACPDLNGGSTPDDYVKIIYGALTHTAEMYNIDTSRIAICGYQWGGGIAVQLGLIDPVTFKGIIALAPEISMDYITQGMWENKTKIPMGFILGENDTTYYAPVHQLIVEFQTNGAKLDYIDKPDLTHGGKDYWGMQEFDYDVESILKYMFKDNQNASFFLNIKDHDFGETNVGDSIMFRCRLTNTGIKTLTNFNLAFDINPDGVFSFVDDIKGRALKNGDTLTFRVKFKPIAEKSYSGKISIQPDTMSSLKQFINITGLGHIPKGILDIKSTIIDFDTVFVNQEAIGNLKLIDTGDADFNITNLTIEGDPNNYFYIPAYSYPMNIEPGLYYSIAIKFKSKIPCRFFAKLKVTTDLDNISTYINLLGVAKDDTTYVEELGGNADNFEVYPNPVNDFLNIAANTLRGSILLCDITGNTLQKIKIGESDSGKVLKLSMTGYPAGMYFIVIESGGKRYVRQVVKAE